MGVMVEMGAQAYGLSFRLKGKDPAKKIVFLICC